MTMKIAITPNVCSGHARCQRICPEVFGGDDFGYVDLKISDVPPELQTSAREAVNSCPEGAINISDAS